MSRFNFKYELDIFQKNGCESIDKGNNILITAHTGSGKTTLALYAIAKAFANNKKVIYTSPIKSLSNQKYAEFSEQFKDSEKSIGILTGDIKINPCGDLLIMTAEILRNAILQNTDENLLPDQWKFNPNEISCVILDEVHYINNPDRGHIWEQIIINLKPDIQLVMLSATITGANEMTQWIEKLKNVKCDLFTTSKRPVPLQHGIWWDGEINWVLKEDKWLYNSWNSINDSIQKYYKKNSYNLSEFFKCIKYINDNNMIPSTIFLLNKKLIEDYATKLPYSFVTSEESCTISNIWDNKLANYRKTYETTKDWNNLYKLVIKGIGIHHAGMIPILKEIVEILYSQGLLKILFATETFALGVNMPTKTVIFYNLFKFDGKNSRRFLFPDEYAQMAGRAGRRGKDTLGNVIIVPFKDFIDENQAIKIMISKPQKIISKLNLDFMFTINILNKNLNSITENSDKNFIINLIIDEYLKSFYCYQDKGYNKKILNIITNKINNDDIDKFNRIQELNIWLKNNDNRISLSKKVKQNLENEKNILLMELGTKYTDILEYNISLNKFQQLTLQVELILKFLFEQSYIDTNYILTKSGKILNEISDCNPFILTELLDNDYLTLLDFNEICSVLSIFIIESKNDDYININSLDCSDNCKKLLYNITTICDSNIIKEKDINNILPYPSWLDWSLDYTMFHSVKFWCSNYTWHDIYNTYQINQGNFIKTILRLVNLIRNIENICRITDNIPLLNILYGYQEKLLRDIVMTESLYI